MTRFLLLIAWSATLVILEYRGGLLRFLGTFRQFKSRLLFIASVGFSPRANPFFGCTQV